MQLLRDNLTVSVHRNNNICQHLYLLSCILKLIRIWSRWKGRGGVVCWGAAVQHNLKCAHEILNSVVLSKFNKTFWQTAVIDYYILWTGFILMQQLHYIYASFSSVFNGLNNSHKTHEVNICRLYLVSAGCVDRTEPKASTPNTFMLSLTNVTRWSNSAVFTYLTTCCRGESSITLLCFSYKNEIMLNKVAFIKTLLLHLSESWYWQQLQMKWNDGKTFAW